MVQAQLQQLEGPGGLLRREVVELVEQLLQPPIHPLAPGQHGLDGGAGEQTPLGARMAGTDSVVIGIEEEAPLPIQGLPAHQVGGEHKGVEKPGGVAQVPFGWAGIGHPLEAEIFRRQRGDQGLAPVAHGQQLRQQRGGNRGEGCRADRWHHGFRRP